MLQGQGLAQIASLDGNDLKRLFAAATRCLERHRDAVNALNVFPVPDGDTGTNMLLTMRSLNDESANAADSSAGAVMASIAQGALLGARGNSGVILSQFFQGMAKGFEGKELVTAQDLGLGLQLASTAAYNAVGRPVEGTILTVIRELSMVAQERLISGSPDLSALLKSVVEAAKDAVSRTPLQLPVLREAGVVDAGGQGLAIILEGALYSLMGEDVDEAKIELCSPSQDQPLPLPHVQEQYLTATENELYGYCIQFLIQGQDLVVDQVRQNLSAIADSTVAVGDERLVKVHAHSFDPGPVISYGVSLGTVSQVRIDNIDEQHQEFMSIHRSQLSAQEVAVVGIVWGDGFPRLFKELGCKGTVAGGQTMNPSTGELLDAATSTGAQHVIILPNNSNILPAAHQATSMAESKVYVIPSTSLPQGVAAMLAFNPEESLEHNLEVMQKALGTVKTIEVTRAVRDATVAGIKINQGQLMGLLEGQVTAIGNSPHTILVEILQKAGALTGHLVTLYWGDEVTEEEAHQAGAYLRKSLPELEVEVVEGGQPLYPYVASLE